MASAIYPFNQDQIIKEITVNDSEQTVTISFWHKKSLNYTYFTDSPESVNKFLSQEQTFQTVNKQFEEWRNSGILIPENLGI